MEYLKQGEVGSYEVKGVEGEYLRTGVYEDMSFFHAMYYPFRHYRYLNEDDKHQWVRDKIQIIRDHFTLEDWVGWKDGSTAFLQIAECMKTYSLTDPLLMALLGDHILQEQIVPRWIRECSTIEKPFDAMSFLNRMKHVWFQNFLEQITLSILRLEQSHTPPPAFMTKEEKLKVCHKLAYTSYELLDAILQQSWETFQKDMVMDSSLDLSSLAELIEPLGIGCNILVMDAESGEPVCTVGTFVEDMPTIIVLSFDQQHYEPLGKVISMDDGRKTVSRLFSREDDILYRFGLVFAG